MYFDAGVLCCLHTLPGGASVADVLPLNDVSGDKILFTPLFGAGPFALCVMLLM